MPSYQTITGENQSNVAMGAGTSLFRKLLTVGAGFTVTAWDLEVRYGADATAAATGLQLNNPFADLQLKFALSYGASPFGPPNLIGNTDDPGILWYSAGEPQNVSFIVPAASTWQSTYFWRQRISARYQFRLAAASDFCLLIGNNLAATNPFGFTATLKVSYA